jgi:phage terminase small subunit
MTDQVKKFLERYFETLKGKDSAIWAGFSEKTAVVQASQMLAIPENEDYLNELREKAELKHGITKDLWLSELRESGFSNIQDFISEGNSIKDISSIDRSKASAVSSIKKTVIEFEGGNKETTEFKLNNKLDALDKIGRHLGYFEKDNSQKVPEAPKTLKIEIVRPVEDDE